MRKKKVTNIAITYSFFVGVISLFLLSNTKFSGDIDFFILFGVYFLVGTLIIVSGINFAFNKYYQEHKYQHVFNIVFLIYFSLIQIITIIVFIIGAITPVYGFLIIILALIMELLLIGPMVVFSVNVFKKNNHLDKERKISNKRFSGNNKND